MSKSKDALTVSRLIKMKERNEKIVMATAYDYPSALLVDAAGVDMILVGDSLGNVVQGRETTLSVTLDQMIYHSEIVARAANRAFVVVDMPFPYCQLGPNDGLRAAARIMQETGADAVKIESGRDRIETVRAIVRAGIPVLGHCGLQPQSVHISGYKVQRDHDRLMDDAEALCDAGVFGILLECVPRESAGEAARKFPVPVIGIGAGNLCDGQVLVFHDYLLYGLKTKEELPKHARSYASIGEIIVQATGQYIKDVRSGSFPSEEESF
ncbi:MAG: 3-methyl-2-oxobutanoate hydroxymethyltransferase [Planctomycetia bacterium]|nr:3-methyl-2-oxobutanoate hydroxymethyltransferase [Planctomycetia bacterium]